ncbi:MAG: choice-of-anchor Q domain-containing protein [Myxococcota bacterium]
MKRSNLIALLVGVAGVLPSSTALAATIVVDTTADTFTPGACRAGIPGMCSLRTAVYRASQSHDWDTIVLSADTYVIDNVVEGPIDIKDAIFISGAGVGQTTIQVDLPGEFGMHATGSDTWVMFGGVSVEGVAADAGAIHADGAQYVYFSQSEVHSFDYDTEVVYADDADLLIQGTTFTGNTTDSASGSVVRGVGDVGGASFAWIYDATFTANEANGSGAVLSVDYDDSTMDGVEVSDCQGDVIVDMQGPYDIDDMHFHDNNSSQYGVRVSDNMTGTVSSSTFSHNQLLQGTIRVESDGHMMVHNSTFALNAAQQGSVVNNSGWFGASHVTAVDNASHLGAFYRNGGTMDFVLNAIDGHPGNPACGGPTPNLTFGYNVFADDSCDTAPNDLTNTDLQVGPLADNGGPTPTMMPLPGSPMIDAFGGVWVSPVDQRGESRNPGDDMDVGAVECQPGECI